AVQGISFGIRKGECFGLLGVNGAGKSTLFKMITSEIPITSGDAFISGYSVTKNLKETRQRLGYCPQFDAMCSMMSVQEHLAMFSRFRGAPKSKVSEIVQWGLDNLGLKKFANYLPGKLSGGNRRKLAVALSLIGNPDLICLDEPTTGVDPGARSYVWRCIASSTETGHGVLLTTHSMEECESLCHRLTIQVSGRLMCFGSLQHIKSKFNKGYTILIKLKIVPKAEQDKMVEEVTKYIRSKFKEIVLEQRNFNVLSYNAKIEASSLSNVFDMLSKAKKENLFEDFSISQTTLEQV
ncbi:hypothetical protein HELRODRAFT_132743, partial [Helobdella robusta]|uniref:ABC transporter domain-containing protein n=1 Tax=Helobdella robusta TaxID=6412 RepID=T1EHZ2_HELRO